MSDALKREIDKLVSDLVKDANDEVGYFYNVADSSRAGKIASACESLLRALAWLRCDAELDALAQSITLKRDAVKKLGDAEALRKQGEDMLAVSVGANADEATAET